MEVAIVILTVLPALLGSGELPEPGAVPVQQEPARIPIAEGWARSSVNAVIFRRSSVVTHGDHQYVAFYDPESRMVLAKREHGSSAWELATTRYSGNTRDAHNSISIAVDGAGFLHVSWDHHGGRLRYCRGTAPGSLELTDEMPMTGETEGRVTYPELYLLPGGDLLFLYRDGSSGNGNLMMNRWDVETRAWSRVQDGLLDGEGQRNAYWQLALDPSGTIHLSWVWRETGGVQTNHDLGYARSRDGGVTWERSDGAPYELPITAATSEYACRIPQNSELINQTSMAADTRGRPYIATYWRPEGTEVPQYRLVWHDGTAWHVRSITRRTTPFVLRGGGTRRPPISRPQLAIRAVGEKTGAAMLFRDVERGHRVSVALCDDLGAGEWRFRDLTEHSVGRWEPTFDPVRWAESGELHVFVQRVGQGAGEQLEDLPPQMVSILEWRPD